MIRSCRSLDRLECRDMRVLRRVRTLVLGIIHKRVQPSLDHRHPLLSSGNLSNRQWDTAIWEQNSQLGLCLVCRLNHSLEVGHLRCGNRRRLDSSEFKIYLLVYDRLNTFCRVGDWGAMLSQDMAMGAGQGGMGGTMSPGDARAGTSHGVPQMQPHGQPYHNQPQ